ncbi:MAG: hypothetical protein RR630_06650 [Coprobacillus sp.]
MQFTINPNHIEFLENIMKEKEISIHQYIESLLWKTIDDDQKTITIISIGHRRDIYNKMVRDFECLYNLDDIKKPSSSIKLEGFL